MRLIFNYTINKKYSKLILNLTDIANPDNYSKCKYNNYSETGETIDPISMEPIPFHKIYMMNGMCYHRRTIVQLLLTTKKDPFTRENIPEQVFEDFNLSTIDLDLSDNNMTDTELIN